MSGLKKSGYIIITVCNIQWLLYSFLIYKKRRPVLIINNGYGIELDIATARVTTHEKRDSRDSSDVRVSPLSQVSPPFKLYKF